MDWSSCPSRTRSPDVDGLYQEKSSLFEFRTQPEMTGDNKKAHMTDDGSAIERPPHNPQTKQELLSFPTIKMSMYADPADPPPYTLAEENIPQPQTQYYYPPQQAPQQQTYYPQQQQQAYQPPQSQQPYQPQTTQSPPPVVQVVQTSDDDTAIIFLVGGFFFPILWLIGFFLTRGSPNGSKAKMYGNIGCAIWSIMLGLSLVSACLAIVGAIVWAIINAIIIANRAKASK